MGDRVERELKLKEEIRKRLEGICSNLSPDEFQKLIDKIAANQLKGESRPYRFGSPALRALGEPRTPPRPRRSA